MKIVVIGGTGGIGSKSVPILRQGGHEVLAASPKSGVDSITGDGLKEAMAGAQVVIDLSNSPSFDDKAVLEFFETSGRNLLAAEVASDRQWLFSRQGRPGETDRGLRHPPHHCPRSISTIPRRHRRFRWGWRRGGFRPSCSNPLGEARLGRIGHDEWLRRAKAAT